MEKSNRQITEFLKQSYGIDVSKYDDSFLNRSLQKSRIETQTSSEKVYSTVLEKNEIEGKAFLESLNISYTEFFRNPLTFAVLERIILPSVALKKGKSKQKEIRVWSAACAAGQEVYSLAILLEELINDGKDNLNYRIFGTDLKNSQVKEAQKGRYVAANLNNLNLKRVNQWFTKKGDTYIVNQELKRNIDFSVFDLFNEQLGCPPASIFGDFDLVICANLLFYYKPEYQKNILEKMGNCIAKDGYLITGETERDIVLNHNYCEVYPQSAIFQKMGYW
jgi:chemotaxis methyl-accepting protein methylase